jgi:hypothetical protein
VQSAVDRSLRVMAQLDENVFFEFLSHCIADIERLFL